MSHAAPADSSHDAIISMMGTARSWDPEWRSFRQAFPDWTTPVASTSPLYCLPKPASTRLARMHGQSPALLDTPMVEAELAFADLCQAHHAVGCWSGSPIIYEHLSPPAVVPNADVMRQAGWTRADQLKVRRGLEGVQDATLRLKGYAGWLLTEPAFLAETALLAEQWQSLPARQRPSFPLRRAVPVPTRPPGGERAPAAVVDFSTAAREFLDRWGLTQLTTWDLPNPQGPFLPNVLPPGSPALPSHGIHLVLPMHYPLQGDDGLLQQILDFQRQAARGLGLDESLAGLPHYKAYASMLEVIQLERSIRARYQPARRLQGLVSRIEEAMSAALGGSVAQVQKLRKAIAACRRGCRARIAWLRRRGH